MRSLAREALAWRHGTAPDRSENASPEEYDLDETLGVRVMTSDGRSQFSYEVTGEEARFNGLRHKHGQDLLSDDEIEQLSEYAEPS